MSALHPSSGGGESRHQRAFPGEDSAILCVLSVQDVERLIAGDPDPELAKRVQDAIVSARLHASGSYHYFDTPGRWAESPESDIDERIRRARLRITKWCTALQRRRYSVEEIEEMRTLVKQLCFYRGSFRPSRATTAAEDGQIGAAERAVVEETLRTYLAHGTTIEELQHRIDAL